MFNKIRGGSGKNSAKEKQLIAMHLASILRRVMQKNMAQFFRQLGGGSDSKALLKQMFKSANDAWVLQKRAAI